MHLISYFKSWCMLRLLFVCFRVMFGSNHLYVFHNPADEARQLKAGQKVITPTFDSAQEEIAESAGFGDLLGNESGKSKGRWLP